MNSKQPFKWKHFQGEIILLCVRWYLRYALSYRNLEEIMLERGLSVDHTTIYRVHILLFANVFNFKQAIRSKPTMLSVLWQEISKLKQDRIFTNNLCYLMILTLIFCCSLSDLQSDFLRMGKQKQIAQFSHKASAGMVIKTCHTFYR